LATAVAAIAAPPVSTPADEPPNPWPPKLLNGFAWAKALAVPDRLQRRDAVHKLIRAWTLKHADAAGVLDCSITGEFAELTPSAKSTSSLPLTAVFECRGTLADGAPYLAIARVRLVDPDKDSRKRRGINQQARAKAEKQYEVGKLYVVTGVTKDFGLGMEVPEAHGKKADASHPPGLELTFYFEPAGSATVKEYVPAAKK
jgi:hypothetical protein